jgi:hypothetical protein
VVEHIEETNCIVEILQENQKTQSIRYFEAIFFNKKLLTNNPRITELPYYDERFMKFFSSADGIDFEWVRKKEAVDYGYRGEFSPVHFVEQIEKDFAD